MTHMHRARSVLCGTILVLAVCGCSTPQNTIVIGSKNFPEQAILGELLAQQIETKTSLHVERRFYLSGTYICHQALLAGRIDMYVEYTGTALTAILKEQPDKDPLSVFNRVRDEYARRFHLVVEPPLGFNNSFAIVIRGDDARRESIHTISQSVRFVLSWRPAFGYEFMERPDGYDGLIKTYGLKFSGEPRIMDLNLLYRALLSHQVDVIAGNTTDGQLLTNDFTVLEDDKRYFPPYQAVTIVRERTLSEYPAVTTALASLQGRVSDRDMQLMNYEVVAQHKDMAVVVREFLHSAEFNSENTQ